MKKRRRLNLMWQRFFREWHRRLAIVAGSVLLYWIVTGLLLNHAHDFSLDKRPVNQGWLLDWYDIQAPDEIVLAKAGELIWVKTDDLLWLPKQQVMECTGRMLGAGVMRDGYWSICGSVLWLFDQTGRALEEIDLATLLELPPARAGSSETGELVVETVDRKRYFTVDGWDWHEAPETLPVHWQRTYPLSHEASTLWRKRYRAHWLNWARVVQDMHSGRFFGAFGLWLVDIAFLILCFTSLSGLYLWAKMRRP
ncbi:MAG: PepSY domain-containing protein [Gammaproteobacteria bacterium]|nr:MAG: PepSY domain-containing protein [Gammaproteobacteria bacterium]